MMMIIIKWMKKRKEEKKNPNFDWLNWWRHSMALNYIFIVWQWVNLFHQSEEFLFVPITATPKQHQPINQINIRRQNVDKRNHLFFLLLFDLYFVTNRKYVSTLPVYKIKISLWNQNINGNENVSIWNSKHNWFSVPA